MTARPERLLLTPEERREARSVMQVWRAEDLRQAALEEVGARFGISPRDVLTMMLHLDTIHWLERLEGLVLKGGTALQGSLPAERQRVSIDLDFNTSTPNPQAVLGQLEELAVEMEEEGAVAAVRGIRFGGIRFFEHDRAGGIVRFRRLLPSPFDDVVTVREEGKAGPPRRAEGEGGGRGAAGRGGSSGPDGPAVRVQGMWTTIEVNYHHHELPAVRTTREPLRFFPQEVRTPRTAVRPVRASMEDLCADKILATTHYFGFGRERFKDVYDLISLRHDGKIRRDQVAEKLDRVVGPQRRAITVGGSCDTVLAMGTEAEAAQGFSQSVCVGGREYVRRWGEESEAVAEWLELIGRKTRAGRR